MHSAMGLYEHYSVIMETVAKKFSVLSLICLFICPTSQDIKPHSHWSALQTTNRWVRLKRNVSIE